MDRLDFKIFWKATFIQWSSLETFHLIKVWTCSIYLQSVISANVWWVYRWIHPNLSSRRWNDWPPYTMEHGQRNVMPFYKCFFDCLCAVQHHCVSEHRQSLMSVIIKYVLWTAHAEWSSWSKELKEHWYVCLIRLLPYLTLSFHHSLHLRFH